MLSEGVGVDVPFQVVFGIGSYEFSWQRAVKRVHCCYLLVYLTKETLKDRVDG